MKTDFSINIGSRIRHFRELSGLTQLELSELVSCEPSTLAHYETGKNLVSMTKLKKIADVLGVEPYQFFIENKIATDKSITGSINKLLTTASKLQLKLIYNIISNILDMPTNKPKR